MNISNMRGLAAVYDSTGADYPTIPYGMNNFGQTVTDPVTGIQTTVNASGQMIDPRTGAVLPDTQTGTGQTASGSIFGLSTQTVLILLAAAAVLYFVMKGKK